MLPDRPSLPPRVVDGVAPEEACVLAVDLGTGGPKVAVVSATGMVVAHAFEPVPLALTPDGGAEQDPEDWWTAVVAAGRRALADSGVPPEQVVGIGCTAHWAGTVPVGPDGVPLAPALTWMDSRGSAAVRRAVRGAVNAFGYDVAKVARWIRRSGGAPSLSGKDPVGHILYLRQARPDVYGRTAVFLEPVDYLNLQLTGLARASYDSITIHWVTDNRHLDRVDYDPTLLAMAGLGRSTLPDLVPTGAVLAGLAPDPAAVLGLVPGTPVVTGTGDLHSAAVGSGAVDDFAGHLYVGTSSWISCHVPFKKTSAATNVTTIPSGIPGRYLVADEHETAGACMTWLRDHLLFGDDGLAAGAPDGRAPADFFDRLNRVAASVPAGAGGVLFTPWLNGERSPVDDHTIRGGFHNLSLSTTRADMVRAAFEGVALNSRWLLGAVERFTGRPFPSLAFIGGGASSDLWAQVHADVTGRTIRQVTDPVLANVRGAGLLTLLALGRVRAADIPGMVAVRAEYRPDPHNRAVYDQLAAEFVNLYKQTKGIHRRLNRGRLG
ncbi:MAG TPA: FGGY-family carbohydrate kinase [Acidimicrobiales bacterium]|nr:FGGY-family carbohydrate kinase [Acidimicrobiales bacterium]